MAQDSGSPNSKAQDIDLDDIEVNILIICKSAKNLNQASMFLTRRGWPTTTLTNVSKAVEYIAENRPDFVLLSFTHPSPAMLKLPDLILQTFNLVCIGMVETNDSQSVNKLKEAKMRNKVQGAPSGPNLQRVIRRILTEKLSAANESNPRAKGEDVDAGKDSVVTIKGIDNVTVRGNVASTARASALTEDVAHISGQSNADFDTDLGEESVSTGTYTMSKANRRSLKSLLNSDAQAEQPDVSMAKLKASLFGDQPADAEMPDDDDVAIASIAAARELEKSGELDENAQPKARGKIMSLADKLSSGQGLGSDSTNNNSLSSGQGLSSGSPAPASAMTAGQGLSTGSTTSGQGLSAGLSAPQSSAPSSAPTVSAAANTTKDFSPPPTTEVDAVGTQISTATADLSPEQMLRLAVESSLRRVCTPVAGARAKPLGVVEKVAVFSLESATVSGYLVIAIEHDPNKIEDFFLKACESALREEFGNLKVSAVIDNGFWVHIPAVEFVTWANVKAKFHVTMAHDSSQAAIAFFPMERQPRAQLASDEQQMFSIALDDISTDHPINFKAYLHLKINDKYFLYLRNGRQLQPEQKSRLKDRKVDNIFMKGVDVENLNMFLAASFLRNSIKAAS